MKCPRCGTDLPDTTAVCPVCGHNFKLGEFYLMSYRWLNPFLMVGILMLFLGFVMSILIMRVILYYGGFRSLESLIVNIFITIILLFIGLFLMIVGIKKRTRFEKMARIS